MEDLLAQLSDDEESLKVFESASVATSNKAELGELPYIPVPPTANASSVPNPITSPISAFSERFFGKTASTDDDEDESDDDDDSDESESESESGSGSEDEEEEDGDNESDEDEDENQSHDDCASGDAPSNIFDIQQDVVCAPSSGLPEAAGSGSTINKVLLATSGLNSSVVNEEKDWSVAVIGDKKPRVGSKEKEGVPAAVLDSNTLATDDITLVANKSSFSLQEEDDLKSLPRPPSLTKDDSSDDAHNVKPESSTQQQQQGESSPSDKSRGSSSSSYDDDNVLTNFDDMNMEDAMSVLQTLDELEMGKPLQFRPATEHALLNTSASRGGGIGLLESFFITSPSLQQQQEQQDRQVSSSGGLAVPSFFSSSSPLATTTTISKLYDALLGNRNNNKDNNDRLGNHSEDGDDSDKDDGTSSDGDTTNGEQKPIHRNHTNDTENSHSTDNTESKEQEVAANVMSVISKTSMTKLNSANSVSTAPSNLSLFGAQQQQNKRTKRRQRGSRYYQVPCRRRWKECCTRPRVRALMLVAVIAGVASIIGAIVIYTQAKNDNNDDNIGNNLTSSPTPNAPNNVALESQNVEPSASPTSKPLTRLPGLSDNGTHQQQPQQVPSRDDDYNAIPLCLDDGSEGLYLSGITIQFIDFSRFLNQAEKHAVERQFKITYNDFVGNDGCQDEFLRMIWSVAWQEQRLVDNPSSSTGSSRSLSIDLGVHFRCTSDCPIQESPLFSTGTINNTILLTRRKSNSNIKGFGEGRRQRKLVMSATRFSLQFGMNLDLEAFDGMNNDVFPEGIGLIFINEFFIRDEAVTILGNSGSHTILAPPIFPETSVAPSSPLSSISKNTGTKEEPFFLSESKPMSNIQDAGIMGVADLDVMFLEPPTTTNALPTMDPPLLSQSAHHEAMIVPDIPDSQPKMNATSLRCRPNEFVYQVKWGAVTPFLRSDLKDTPQTLQLDGTDTALTLTVTEVGTSSVLGWGLLDAGYLRVTASSTIAASNIITADGSNATRFPSSFSRFIIELNRQVTDLYISISDIDSGPFITDVVRIQMYDQYGKKLPGIVGNTGEKKENVVLVSGEEETFACAPMDSKVSNPGLDAALYMRANQGIKRIELDQSIFSFTFKNVGNSPRRTVFPGIDFAFCQPASENS